MLTPKETAIVAVVFFFTAIGAFILAAYFKRRHTLREGKV